MTQEPRRISTSDIAAVDERSGEVRRVDAAEVTPLFITEDAEAYRTRWGGIQSGFVDEPRKAVEEADALVAEVMKRLAEGFADERRRLESQWEHADQVSTEDLRVAMQRYRSFFERLLAV